MRLIIAICLAANIASAAFAQSSDDDKRKIVMPSVVALSDCVAFKVVQSSGGEGISKSTISPMLTSALAACAAFKADMLRIYDQTLGPGSGQVFFDGPYKHDLTRAVFQRIASGNLRMPPSPTSPSPVVAQAETPAPAANADEKPNPTATSSVSMDDKKIVEDATAQAQAEGLMVDPLGSDKNRGIAVYQSHLDEYLACIKTQILEGKIDQDKSVPNDKDKSCLREFVLQSMSCAVYFGKYELDKQLNTTASSFCSFSYAMARVKFNENMKVSK